MFACSSIILLCCCVLFAIGGGHNVTRENTSPLMLHSVQTWCSKGSVSVRLFILYLHSMISTFFKARILKALRHQDLVFGREHSFLSDCANVCQLWRMYRWHSPTALIWRCKAIHFICENPTCHLNGILVSLSRNYYHMPTHRTGM